MACEASFLKHYHTPVIHFGILHFKNEETLFYSAGPISQYSQIFSRFGDCLTFGDMCLAVMLYRPI